nr:hypothetical protein [Flavobacteriaceae bacterium]
PELIATDSPSSNYVVHTDYFNTVQNSNFPITVSSLQKQLSNYDVAGEKGFDGRKEDFMLLVKGDIGTIRAFFDTKGAITATSETYKNVVLPKEIQQKLREDYTKFKQIRNKLKVTYEPGHPLEFCYTVVVKANGKKSVRTFGSAAE